MYYYDTSFGVFPLLYTLFHAFGVFLCRAYTIPFPRRIGFELRVLFQTFAKETVTSGQPERRPYRHLKTGCLPSSPMRKAFKSEMRKIITHFSLHSAPILAGEGNWTAGEFIAKLYGSGAITHRATRHRARGNTWRNAIRPVTGLSKTFDEGGHWVSGLGSGCLTKKELYKSYTGNQTARSCRNSPPEQ